MVLPSVQQKHRHEAEELLRYVQEGNSRRVERALAGGADIDGRDAELDLPPLILAADRAGVKMVKLLLRKGADVNAAAARNVPCCSDSKCNFFRVVAGSTALHVAVSRRRLDVVRLLLRSGRSTNVAGSLGSTSLHMACNARGAEGVTMVAMVTTLLEAGADPLLTDACGRLPIHFAASRGHTGIVHELLLKAPVALNRPDSESRTPLWFAAANGREYMVLHLLRLGAKQPVATEKELLASPLAAAVEKNHDGTLRILLDHGMGAVGSTESMGLAIESAARNDRAKSLTILLGHFDGDGTRRGFASCRTASCRTGGFLGVLYLAAMHGSLATFGVLLAADADEMVAVINGARYASEEFNTALTRVDPATTAALLRMLKRLPAFRAVSWRWPTQANSQVGPAGGGPAVTLPGGRHVNSLGVKTFRWRSKERLSRLLSRFARYTLKE